MVKFHFLRRNGEGQILKHCQFTGAFRLDGIDMETGLLSTLRESAILATAASPADHRPHYATMLALGFEVKLLGKIDPVTVFPT